MIARLAALVAAVSLLAACAPSGPSEITAQPSITPQASEPDVDPRDYTFRIRNRFCISAGTGSAVLIAPDVLVTNRHVVESATTVEAETWDGEAFTVKVARSNMISDLAIVELADPITDVTPASLGRNPEQGDAVSAVGYPRGGPITKTDGKVKGLVDGSDYGEVGQVIQFTAGIEPGSSGGPLIGEDGSVVGIVFAEDIRTSTPLAITVTALRRALEHPSANHETTDCFGDPTNG